MKKLTGKLLKIAAAVFTAAALASCGTGFDDALDLGITGNGSGAGGSGGDGIEYISSLANSSANWSTAIVIPADYCSRIQVGSKIIIDVEENTIGADTYLKFHADNGSWGECGVSEYFKIDGTKLTVTEDSDNAGVYNTDNVENGSYYFVATASNINKLKSGFALNGCFKLKKIGITNLAAASGSGEGPSIVGKSVSGNKITFTATKASVDNTNAMVIFELTRTAENQDMSLSLNPATVEVKVNDNAVSVSAPISLSIDQYADIIPGTEIPSKYRYKLSLGRQIQINDTVTVELKTATVSAAGASITEDLLRNVSVIFVDTAESAGYWNPLVGDSDNYKPLIANIS